MTNTTAIIGYGRRSYNTPLVTPRDPGSAAPREPIGHDTPVASRGQMALGSTGGRGAVSYQMRRTDADRRPPRKVVTAKLLGDPAPGRSAQDKLLAAVAPPPEPAPVLPTTEREASIVRLCRLGKSYGEIAAELGVSRGAIAGAAHRAKNKGAL